MRATPARLVAAAALLAAAAVVGLPAGPASAAACTSGSGVTVVVDFNQLGGGVQQICDRDGDGESAYALFDEHFELTRVQRFPAFVCRIQGLPTADDEPCVDTPPSDAYWSLYWSDGRSGRWSYSSSGAGSLVVDDGWSVAFSWKEGAAAAPPSVAAGRHPETSEPSPTPEDGDDGGNGGNGGDGGGNRGTGPAGPASESPSPSATETSASPTESPTATPARKAKSDKKKLRPTASASASPTPVASPGDEPSDDPSDDITPTSSPADADGDGLPRWVAPGLIVALFAVAGATVLVRRRAG